MRRRSRNLISLFAVVILLSFSACMTTKNAGIDREADRIHAECEKNIAHGDYKGALDVYANARRKRPNDQTILAGYRKTIEGMRHVADAAFSKEDFAASGRIYHVLLKNHPSYQEVNNLSFDKAYLQARLEECSSGLSQRALEQYRQGNLSEAITIWKSALAFDPGNKGIMKALDTATIQMKNLNSRETPSR